MPCCLFPWYYPPRLFLTSPYCPLRECCDDCNLQYRSIIAIVAWQWLQSDSLTDKVY
eukprot:gene1322-biopygen2505